MGAVEANASRGETVNVRGMDLFGSVTTEIRVKIIDDDEQNVAGSAAESGCAEKDNAKGEETHGKA